MVATYIRFFFFSTDKYAQSAQKIVFYIKISQKKQNLLSTLIQIKGESILWSFRSLINKLRCYEGFGSIVIW